MDNNKKSRVSTIKDFIKSVILSDTGLFCVGVLAALGTLIYSLISSPIFLYRWIIYKYVSLFCPSDEIKPVDIGSVAMATEFLPTNLHKFSKTSVVLSFLLEGTKSVEELKSEISLKWLEAKDSKAELKYPELQMYIEEWLGFMFWKKDKSFCLDNHIMSKVTPEYSTLEDMEKFAECEMEDLLNKRFNLRRSPWEIHVIHNYKCRQHKGRTDDGISTLCLFLMHHSLTDGVGTLSLFLEQLIGTPLENARKMHHTFVEKRNTILNNPVLNVLKFPFRMLRDVGFLLSSEFISERSPFYVSNKNDIDSHYQISTTSPIIPKEKIRAIMKAFGVNFTCVFAAAAGTATGRLLERRGKVGTCRKLKFFLILPRPDHPGKLVNHFSATFFKVNTTPGQNTIDKLKETNRYLVQSKLSTIPLIFPYICKIFSLNLARIVRITSYMRAITTGCVNLPGCTEKLTWNGMEVLGSHFISGLAHSAVGLAVQIAGYHDQVRCAVTADSTVISMEEIAHFLVDICAEIDKMYDIAMEKQIVRIKELRNKS